MSKPAPSSLNKASQSPWGGQALVQTWDASAVLFAVSGAKNTADRRPWPELGRTGHPLLRALLRGSLGLPARRSPEHDTVRGGYAATK